ncbi:peptidylprolyl isomerase [Tepidiphilus thermophilus]|uniref:Parvulin-like peptidyl-prolyl isomerase n=1 Tax=Tepidiphilus thermophilus TaxID=876478 RepID=A0A0K6IRE5_9PROT|nr:peptidylprolyl isomerase [Tepidiphilus thermophilus]CUB05658.1 Parvulin-like peptidyl-prolyl isomerase [Tepidiphilus thermophilus]
MAVKRRSLPLLGAVFRSALLLLALWAGSTSAAELTRVVAVVNNEPITSTELQQYMVRAKRQVAKQGVQIPEDELRQQVLEQMILEKLQLQVAKRMGITVDDTAIDRAIEDIARRNNMTLDALKQALAADGITFEQFREQIRREMTIARLRDREMEGRVTVSDAEVDHFLANNPDVMRRIEAEAGNVTQTHVRHILARTNQTTNDEAAKAKLLALRERIVNGVDFAELAKANSDDGSAFKGGDLGWINPGDTVPQFEEAMNRLAPGEISQPVKTPFGWHLIQVLERRPLTASEDYRRNYARQLLRRQKMEQAYNAWLQTIRAEAFVEIRRDALEAK